MWWPGEQVGGPRTVAAPAGVSPGGGSSRGARGLGRRSQHGSAFPGDVRDGGVSWEQARLLQAIPWQTRGTVTSTGQSVTSLTHTVCARELRPEPVPSASGTGKPPAGSVVLRLIGHIAVTWSSLWESTAAGCGCRPPGPVLRGAPCSV